MEKGPTTDNTIYHCSLLRRLAAIFYDSLLLCCLIFIAWQPVPLLPEEINPGLGRMIRLGYLIAICFVFFGWFWSHGGQTLGMRAWRVKLVYTNAAHNQNITWRTAWMRFVYACMSWMVVGIGFIWSLFHPAKATWHDLLTQTTLIVIPKTGKK